MGLSFRVRDGTGRFPHAMTAVTLCPHPAGALGRGGGKSGGYNICGVVILLWFVPQATGLLVGNHIVDASSLVSFYHPVVQTLLKARLQGGVWCKLSAY